MIIYRGCLELKSHKFSSVSRCCKMVLRLFMKAQTLPPPLLSLIAASRNDEWKGCGFGCLYTQNYIVMREYMCVSRSA